MINLTQRHVLTIIDLLKEEENRLKNSNIKKINPVNHIDVENWDREDFVVQDRSNILFLEKLREELEREINKATFTFGLNERVNSIHE